MGPGTRDVTPTDPRPHYRRQGSTVGPLCMSEVEVVFRFQFGTSRSPGLDPAKTWSTGVPEVPVPSPVGVRVEFSPGAGERPRRWVESG